MEFMANTNADCCTPTGKYELCGCVAGVAYVQLTVIGGGTVQTAWLNTETGDTFTSKPAGFVTGTCSGAALANTVEFSLTAPTASAPFAAPKDGDTTFVTSTGTSSGTISAYYRYEAAAGVWVAVPIVPAGGGADQVLTLLPDGSRAWTTPAAEVVTSITDTVTGHSIGIYTNEAGLPYSISETVTTVDNMAFDVVTGKLTFDFTDETGNTIGLETSIPVGDKYKTASTTCNNVVSTGTETFTVGTGLAYTPEQDILMYHDAANHMHGSVVSYDSATGVLVVEVKAKIGSGNYCSWIVNLDAIPVAAFVETTTSITGTVVGHAIGTFYDENNLATQINETVTSFTGLAASGTVLGTYTKEDGTTQTLYAPVFKELNRFYVDPNGVDTNSGANEAPFLTVQAAVAAFDQGDVAVINEGVYTGAVTLTLQNTGLVGASGPMGSLSHIASLAVTTASGTSNKVADLTVLGAVTHSGGAPLYMHSVTVNGNYVSTSAAYEEIDGCRIQDGTITKTIAGTLYIKDSLIGNATFSTPNSAIILDNVGIDVGDVLTIGAGVVYMLNDVRGTVNIDPAAIPLATAAQAAGATAAVAKAAETASFNDIRLTNVPTITTATKALVRDALGVVSEQVIAGAPIHQTETILATALQTSHTLAKTPIGKVIVTRNGQDISDSWTWVGAVGTYSQLVNYDSTIDENDKLKFHYEAV